MSPSPSTSARPAPQRTIVIHAIGDVNLDPEYVSGLRDRGFAHAWSGLGGIFGRDDLTVVNLECAVSTLGSRQAKRYTFRGDPAALPAMRSAGIEVANLANNHAMDFGVEGLLDTMSNLRAEGISPVGAGSSEREASRPDIRTVGGHTIAVLGFTEIVPTTAWYADGDRAGVARGTDTDAMTAAVAAAARAADIVLVTIHWGIERRDRPTAEQVARAKSLIDAGADAVFGHHPHVLQPMSIYKSRPIFYSLGNFVWRRSFAESYDTGIAEVTFAPDGSVTAHLLPAYIASSGHPVLVGG